MGNTVTRFILFPWEGREPSHKLLLFYVRVNGCQILVLSMWRNVEVSVSQRLYRESRNQHKPLKLAEMDKSMLPKTDCVIRLMHRVSGLAVLALHRLTYDMSSKNSLES